MDEVEIDGGQVVTWTPPGRAPIKLHLRPFDAFVALEFSERLHGTGPPDAKASLGARVWLAVALVREWSGVRANGGPAPCDEEMRRAFFSQHPDAADAVMQAAHDKYKEEHERKNGSRGGSASGSPTPTSSAGSATTTGPSASATGAEGGAAATG